MPGGEFISRREDAPSTATTCLSFLPTALAWTTPSGSSSLGISPITATGLPLWTFLVMADSDGPPLDSIEAIAAWIWQFADELGEPTISLVGHSMGALGVLSAAAAEPERTAVLVLAGVAAKMPVHPELLEAAERQDPIAYELITDWGHGPRAHLGGHRAPGLWMTGGGRRLLQRDRQGALAVDLAACADYDGAIDAAAKVTAPTTLVLGAGDRMTPPAAAQPLSEALTDVAIVTVPDVGHMMMVERPDEVRVALMTGLAR